MSERPIVSREWSEHAIVGDVGADAESIVFGLVLRGRGRAHLDDVTIEILGDAGMTNEPPRPLAGRGLENVTAFARLFGYVRHFHPSDQAANAE